MITIFERNAIICREVAEAEHAEIRAKGIAEGRRIGVAEGIAEGLAEGTANQRGMLCRLAAKCFDEETVGRVVEFLRSIDDQERLFEVAELIERMWHRRRIA